jgi:predicted Na+-dependent transporter
MNTSSLKVLTTLGISLAIAYWLTDIALALNTFKTVFLGGIFFFSGLLIDIPTVLSDLKRWRLILYANLWNLILSPILFGALTWLIFPELSPAVALLSAVPVGMTVPLFAKLAGGSVSFASVYLVTSTILFPLSFTIIGGLFGIFTSTNELIIITTELLTVILLPLITATMIGRFLNRKNWVKTVSSYGSLICLALILVGVYGGVVQAQGITTGIELIELTLIGILVFLGYHIVGYWSLSKVKREIRISNMLGFTYTNFSLAIVIGEQVWQEGVEVTFLAISSFIWMISYVVIQTLLTKKK